VVLARAGKRVVLVDLDLRNPSLAWLFGLADGRGLTTVALGEASLDDVLAPIPLESGSDAHRGAGGTLHVLALGPLPPRPGEFAASAVASSVLADARARADLVLVLAPPLLGVGDAVALGTSVDALVLVARLGGVRRTMLRDLRRVLETWPAAVLGFVLTGVDAPRAGSRGSGHGVLGVLGRGRLRVSRDGRVRVPPAGGSETAAESVR
jgi:non-specific protein-tyrosine kinase